MPWDPYRYGLDSGQPVRHLHGRDSNDKDGDIDDDVGDDVVFVYPMLAGQSTAWP